MRKINCKREMLWMGEDVMICIQNEQGHLGSIVTAQPYVKNESYHVTLSTWNQLAHKDDTVAALYAKAACEVLHHVCAVACGIHLDDISKEEMQAIMEWVKRDVELMKKELITKKSLGKQ